MKMYMRGHKNMIGDSEYSWGYMSNQLVDKETGSYSPIVYFKTNKETFDLYLLYENSYRVIKGVYKATPGRKSSEQF